MSSVNNYLACPLKFWFYNLTILFLPAPHHCTVYWLMSAVGTLEWLTKTLGLNFLKEQKCSVSLERRPALTSSLQLLLFNHDTKLIGDKKESNYQSHLAFAAQEGR